MDHHIFPVQNEEKQKLPELSPWRGHLIQIVTHDRENSNVDVHKQAMLSTKTEDRPTKKHAESKILLQFLFFIQ